MAIKLVQRIEDNQRMHLRSTLPVFVLASVMASALYMATISFAVQIQDPNKQLIDRLTANFPQQFFYQKQQNCGSLVSYYCGLTEHFSRNCNNFLAFRNNDNQNKKTNNNNVPN
ncbi:hypothetical protein G9A89_019262 [Geosiphon pyriformis]|nr:hypothetical protein G9A89_019262 [Geosiphon pyriformis]